MSQGEKRLSWSVVVICILFILISILIVKNYTKSEFEKCVSRCKWDDSKYTCETSTCACLKEDYVPGAFRIGWDGEECVIGGADVNEVEEINEETTITKDTYSNIKEFCKWPYYEIKYVDEINPKVCYAVRQEKFQSVELDDLVASFEYAGHSPHEYFKNTNCDEMRTLGSFWCLRDKSRCLMLEDNNKICVVVELNESR